MNYTIPKNWKKQFILIYSGQAFSIIGSAAVQFAIIWWLTVQTESAITLTIATIVGFLPKILIGPFAGVLVDRYKRRTVMMLADGLVAFTSVILAIVFLVTGNPPLIIIYALLFVRSLGDTFHSPAASAVIPTIVPAEMLARAGGWSTLITSFANILGPVLGALLIGLFSMPIIMLVDIIGACFAIITLCFVKIPDIRTGEKPKKVLTDLKTGWGAIINNRPLKMIGIPFIFLNFIFAPLSSLMPLMVKTYFNGTAWHNTVAETAFSVGLLGASLIIGIIGTGKKRFFLVGLGSVFFGITTLFAAFVPGNMFMLFALAMFLLGVSNVIINVPSNAYIQQSTPPEMLGKVMAIGSTIMTFSMPLSMIIAGPVTEVVGINNWYKVSGLLLVILSCIVVSIARKLDKYPEKYGVKPIPSSTEEPIEESVESPLEELVEEPVKETIEEPVEELVESPLEELTEIQNPVTCSESYQPEERSSVRRSNLGDVQHHPTVHAPFAREVGNRYHSCR